MRLMNSWLGMVSMLREGGVRQAGGRQRQAHSSRAQSTHRAAIPSPAPPDRNLLWLRFSTSMFLAFSSSRGHSVSWL